MSSLTPSSSVSNVLGEFDGMSGEELLMPMPGQSPEYYSACEAYYRAVASNRTSGNSTALSSTSGASRRRRAKVRRVLTSGNDQSIAISETLLNATPGVVDHMVLFVPEYRNAVYAVFGDILRLVDVLDLPLKSFQSGWDSWCIAQDGVADCRLSNKGTPLLEVLTALAKQKNDLAPDSLGVLLLGKAVMSPAYAGPIHGSSRLVRKHTIPVSDDGYCYVKLFPPSQKLLVFDIGPWPSLRLLVEVSFAKWFSLDVSTFSVVRSGEDRVHLVPAHSKDEELTNAMLNYCWISESGRTNDTEVSALRVGGQGDEETQLGVFSDYNAKLMSLIDRQGEKLSYQRLSVLSKSAALLSSSEKREVKMLEALGDAALTVAVAKKCSLESRTPEEYQAARSVVTSNPALSKVFVTNELDKYVAFVAGVAPGQGKAGAYVLEAILGTFYEVYGGSAVTMACEKLGIFAQYSGF